jgi:hypothetical protein
MCSDRLKLLVDGFLSVGRTLWIRGIEVWTAIRRGYVAPLNDHKDRVCSGRLDALWPAARKDAR